MLLAIYRIRAFYKMPVGWLFYKRHAGCALFAFGDWNACILYVSVTYTMTY